MSPFFFLVIFSIAHQPFCALCVSSTNFAKHTNLSQHNVIMVGLMSRCRFLREDRESFGNFIKD